MRMDGAASAASLDGLPDAVLALVVENLNFRDASSVRGLSRALRRLVDARVWSLLDAGAASPEGLGQLAALLVVAGGAGAGAGEGPSAGGASSRRWIRLAPVASLRFAVKSLKPQPSEPAAAGAASQRAWDASLALVSACRAASGGLGGVEIEYELGCPSQAGSCAAELLCALDPSPQLRRLVLSKRSGLCGGRPGDLDLEPLLRPFPLLSTLVLPACFGVRSAEAAAIGRCLPQLKRLEMATASSVDLGPIAGLPALETLEVPSDRRSRDDDFRFSLSPLLPTLAAGAAARSLRTLRCGATTSLKRLNAEALAALPRLAALETFEGPFEVTSSVASDDVAAALAACPALRRFGPLCMEPCSLGLLDGLAAALERAPRLALDVRIEAWGHPSDHEAALRSLAALARAARGGRLDLALQLDLPPARLAATAAALAPAPPRTLTLGLVLAAKEAADRVAALPPFAACALERLEVRLVARHPLALDGALLEAAERALPAARIAR